MHTLNTGRIIVATDLHYGLGRNSKTKLGILKNCVEPQILAELASGDGDKTFVVCGDLFHEMVSVRTDIYQEARRFVTECAKNAHVVLLAGNHDCYDDSTDITSVELFDHLDNVEVVRRPREMDLYGLKCLLLPWSDDNMSAFDFPDEGFDCVFCHPDVPKEFFSGLFVLDNNRKMTASEANARRLAADDLISSGLEKTSFSDGSENDGLVSKLETVRKVVSLAKRGGYVFAGHIHKHSESIVLGRKFTFVGAPYQTTSEEIDTRSGYYTVGPGGVEFKDVRAPEFVKVRFSEVKERGVDAYDFSRIRGNIIQFDGDAVITVETEARLKRRILDEEPYEMSDTDYSNLVMEQHSVENAEEYQKAFASSPKGCVDLYIDNLPDDLLSKEKVERKHVKKAFDAIYELIERKNGSAVSDGGADIVYKKLVATNFLSYDRLEFDFEGCRGLTLIYGRNLDNVGATNACGKSNIIKALVYALFGRFPKKVKKENMSPWDSPTKDVDVTITLESNGVEYRIESGMLRGKDSYHRVYNLTEDKDITKKQLAETRKFIETEILHCGFDMFMKTTVLTSSEIFNFYCMKKEDKDDYLNTIFGTKTLNEVRESIKSSMKSYRAQFMETSRLIESKEHDIELNRSTSEQFEAGRKSNVARIDAEIGQLEDERSRLEAERERLAAEKSDSDAKALKEADSALKDASARFDAARREVSDINRELGDCSTTEMLYTGELKKHKGLLPRLCSDCRKVVSDEYRISEYVDKIKAARERARTAKARLSEADALMRSLQAERDEIGRRAAELKNRMSAATFDESRLARLDAVLESKRNMRRFVEEQANPNTAIVESLEADRARLQVELDEMEAKIRTLDFVQTKVVSQDVITNLLTSKFIQQLNERIRYYLQRLGLNLGVEFDNDFQYEFVRGSGAHPEFNSLSGGESLRIVIATSFAFKDFLESRRNLSSNIRFLDEFFEKDADNLGMNSTVSILKDFSRIMDQNVFLVSNKLNEIDDSVFDNILVVTIKNGRSSIERERVA